MRRIYDQAKRVLFRATPEGLEGAVPNWVFRHRKVVVLVLQTVLFTAAYGLAYAIRFDYAVPEPYVRLFWVTLPAFLVCKTATFKLLHLYRGLWRYVSVEDVVRIVAASALAGALVLGAGLLWGPIRDIPRSIVPLDFVLTVVFVGGARLSVRMIRQRIAPQQATGEGRRKVLIVGAGEAGMQTLREIQNNPRLGLEAVGLIDDDPWKQHASIRGVDVLGSTRDLAHVAASERVDEVLIAIPSATGRQVSDIVERFGDRSLRFKVLPAVGDLIAGKVSLQQFREVEIEDLLGREHVELDPASIAEEVAGKTVLVTGAGGSIGQELARQIREYGPDRLVMLERHENALFYIDRELRQDGPRKDRIVPVVGDVCDRDLLHEIFLRHHPEVVYHAAAYKHVPMMEASVLEAVRNNVLGSWRLMEVAGEYAVDRFVLVSTDKAVRPSNVMGATKRLAELILNDQSRLWDTRFVAVRFGNVLGSSGSVLPIFREQLRNGGPLTVTDPEVTRYFMTIPEAVQLVIQAGVMGSGGEIFVLDMGEPVKIVDLAERLITLSGKRPHHDIGIVFTGLRPGERLHEMLSAPEEPILPTPHEKILVLGSTSVDPAALTGRLVEIEREVTGRNADRVRELLFSTVRPDDGGEKVVDLRRSTGS